MNANTPTPRPQARVKQPEHPLAGLRFEAVVDRVLLRVTLISPTQFHALRRHLPAAWGCPFVEPVHGHPSHTDTEFLIWVQTPSGPEIIEQGLATLADRFPLSQPCCIDGIEVALDLYPILGERSLPLAGVVRHLIQAHARPPEGEQRVTWRRALPGGGELPSFRFASLGRDLEAELELEYTVQAGDTDAEDRSRYYVKRSDSADGQSYASLPASQHRARMERTLTGRLTPFATLDEWRRFDFAMLFRLLSLRQHREIEVSGLLAAIRPRVRFGKPGNEAARLKHLRQTRRGTVADGATREPIRAALRRLTNSQRGRSRDGRPSHESVAHTASTCGNLGLATPSTDDATQEDVV